MTNERLFHLAKLFELVTEMEKGLGLDVLSEDERAMVYAITFVTGVGKTTFRSSELKSHTLCSKMSTPTFYRNLKRLLAKGVIRSAENKKTSAYEVVFDTFPFALVQS